MSARVSVIMPLFNKAPYVARALASVVGQTFTDIEVIVVDDGSTDTSAMFVEESTDPRLRLVKQSNLGPGAARNRGIHEANGELVAFLDADDEWLPEYLAESVRLLDEGGTRVASVTCGNCSFKSRTFTGSPLRGAPGMVSFNALPAS